MTGKPDLKDAAISAIAAARSIISRDGERHQQALTDTVIHVANQTGNDLAQFIPAYTSLHAALLSAAARIYKRDCGGDLLTLLIQDVQQDALNGEHDHLL